MENNTYDLQRGGMRRWTAAVLLVLIILGAFMLRVRGIAWPRLHADEYAIGAWVRQVATEPYARSRIYPGGFFTLMRPLRRAALSIVQKHQRWLSWAGYSDRISRSEFDDILFARWANAALGALTCLWIYLLARRVTGSRAGPILVTLLCALYSVHVEHCHYAQTDVATVFMLAFSLWMLARAADARTWWPFILAAVSAGFAVGTAYALAVLLVPLLLYSFTRRPAPLRWSYWAVGVGGALGALLLFGFGFVWANPAALGVDGQGAGFLQKFLRVLSEAVPFLGEAGASPAWNLKAAAWGRNLSSLSPGWWFLLMAGVGLSFSRLYRRYWLVLILLPLLLVSSMVFSAPITRKQEFMLLLPVFGVLAALPLAAVSVPGAVRWPWLWRFVFVVPVVQAVMLTWLTGTATSALFGWKDSRLLTNTWLRTHAPADQPVAIEQYTWPASEGAFLHSEPIYKVEHEQDGYRHALDAGYDYILRNASLQVRGMVDPLTHKRLPEYQEEFRDFNSRYELLKAWSPMLDRHVSTSFYGHNIELYGRRPEQSLPYLAMALPRPTLLSEAGRETYGRLGYWLGGSMGVRVTSAPRRIALGGPGNPWPVYLVAVSEHAPVRLRVRCPGRDREVELPLHGRTVLRLDHCAWIPHFLRFEELTLVAESLVRGPAPYVYVQVAMDVNEVWQICRQRGAVAPLADGASDLLDVGVSRLETFERAVETGGWPAAAAYVDDARSEWRSLGQYLSDTGMPLRVNGISEMHYDRFARLRAPRGDEVLTLPVHGDRRNEPPDFRAFRTEFLDRVRDEMDGRAVSHAPMAVPFRLAPGRYEFRFEMKPDIPLEVTDDRPPRFLVVQPDGVVLHAGTWSVFAGNGNRFEPQVFSLDVDVETQPVLHLVSTHPLVVNYRGVEVHWNLRSALTMRYTELAAAFERYDVQAADAAN